jgi:hypothetical protein
MWTKQDIQLWVHLMDLRQFEHEFNFVINGKQLLALNNAARLQQELNIDAQWCQVCVCVCVCVYVCMYLCLGVRAHTIMHKCQSVSCGSHVHRARCVL